MRCEYGLNGEASLVIYIHFPDCNQSDAISSATTVNRTVRDRLRSAKQWRPSMRLCSKLPRPVASIAITPTPDVAQARVKGARTLIEITKLCSEALSGMMMSALRSGPASAAVSCAITPTPDVARTTSVNWSPPWKRLLGVRTHLSQYYRRTREKFVRDIVAL
jgi:hypothetical protein